MILTYQQELSLIKKFLMACSVPGNEADSIADVITHSDFTGVYSHGLSRFVGYIKSYQSKRLNPNPNIHIIQESDATVAFDCDDASGILAVNRVYDDVLKRARKYGIGIGTGTHASNINCGSYYGWRMAEDNVLGIVMSNTNVAMAPYGGAETLIGTNPIIMGCPAGEKYPIVLDISTSNVAMGKIAAYRREGKPIPLGWANDADGVPTTDASKACSAVPIASYKGYGLAVFVDVFGALLANASYGRDIGNRGEHKAADTGFSVILIDIAKFMPIEAFKRRVDEYVNVIKTSKKAVGFDEIFLPGEIEYRLKETLLKTGVDFSDAMCADLLKTAVSLGIANDGDTFEQLICSIEV